MKQQGFKTIFIMILIISLCANLVTASIGIPQMGEIGTQMIDCQGQFAQIDLRQITTDPDHDVSQITYGAFNYFDFEVDINNGIATITNPYARPKAEFIEFIAEDPDGYQAWTKGTFIAVCDEPRNEQQVIVNPSIPANNYPEHIINVPHSRNNVYVDGYYGDYCGFMGCVDQYDYFGFNNQYNGYFGPSFFPDVHSSVPQTCAISTGQGLLQDFDCDKVPDQYDNCLDISNPSQSDQNRNGLGDACDMVIADFNVQTGKLTCGRSVSVSAVVANNNIVPIGAVKATLAVPSVNMEFVDYIQDVQPGSAAEVELTTRIPLSAEPGSYNLLLTLEYDMGMGKEKTQVAQKIKIDSGAACEEQPDDHFVEVQELQDIRAGEAATFPIKIMNTEKRDNSYTFTVHDVDDFGNFRIDPGSLVIVPAQSEETVYLHVWADQGARTGAMTFIVEIRHGAEVEQIVLVANILEGEEENATISWFWLGLVLLVLFILVLIALLFAGVDSKGQKRSRHAVAKEAMAVPEPSNKGIWEEAPNKQKVAVLGIKKEKGWLYYVDKLGDISRSRMKWAQENGKKETEKVAKAIVFEETEAKKLPEKIVITQPKKVVVEPVKRQKTSKTAYTDGYSDFIANRTQPGIVA
ncbi:hypothetical protein ACFL1B_02410 [Nanoarchaeota archaeon]